MVLKDILTEAELSQLPESVGPKLEAAFAAEMNSAIEAERKKSGKKLNALIESISAKAESKIDQAITESVDTMRGNALSDKMYKLVRDMAALIESAGIPVSEDTKRLKAELAQCNINLKKAYAEREHVKQELNDQQKKNFIYKSVQGMRPEVVDAVMNHFINFDIREITSEAISDFLHGKSGTYMMDVDPEANGDLDMDKVNSALNDIDHAFELDNPKYPSRENAPIEYSRGAKASPMKYDLHTPNVSYGLGEAADTMPHGIDPDVASAISQMGSLGSIGFV